MNAIIVILAGLLGAALGSFINAAVFRLYRDMPLVRARSQCVHCSTVLVWHQLIPIGSYLWLGGVCRTCRKPIPQRYLFVETVTALLFAFNAWLWLSSGTFDPVSYVRLGRDLAAIAVLVFLFVYDYEYSLLPDAVTIPATILIALATLYITQSWQPLAIGIGVGAGFFALQYVVSRGRWIGGGDIRFGALIGALVGWPLVLVALFVSYLIGSVFAVWLLATKRKQMGQAIPFGTLLSVGTILTLWFGQPLLTWYLSLL